MRCCACEVFFIFLALVELNAFVAKMLTTSLAICIAIAAEPPYPSNPVNTTLYALRPLDLVDITDKNSADAPGDIFFWMKDHIVKPRHCRVQPNWHQCGESSIIDVNMVYQKFVVEHDSTQVGNYASCNPDHDDPSGKTWACACHGGGHGPSPSNSCVGFGEEDISRHNYPQFQGDPTPTFATKFSPGFWFSTTHDTECGNPRANSTIPCTWLQHRGKIVNASCVNSAVVDVIAAAAGGAVAACEQREGKKCDFLHAAQTNLTDCCIDAFVKGVNSTSRDALVKPFLNAFASDDPTVGGCEPLHVHVEE